MSRERHNKLNIGCWRNADKSQNVGISRLLAMFLTPFSPSLSVYRVHLENGFKWNKLLLKFGQNKTKSRLINLITVSCHTFQIGNSNMSKTKKKSDTKCVVKTRVNFISWSQKIHDNVGYRYGSFLTNQDLICIAFLCSVMITFYCVSNAY